MCTCIVQGASAGARCTCRVQGAGAGWASGFARFNHREFKQFLRIARGSLGEIQDALVDAKDRGYAQEEEFKEIWEISERAIGSITGLMKYLHETKDRRFWGE